MTVLSFMNDDPEEMSHWGKRLTVSHLYTYLSVTPHGARTVSYEIIE